MDDLKLHGKTTKNWNHWYIQSECSARTLACNLESTNVHDKDAAKQARGKQRNYLTRYTSDSRRKRRRIQVRWSIRG